jgi:programmed cell death protein 4
LWIAHDRTHRDKGNRGKVGSAKKGGAGGKGTWGKPGDEYDQDYEIDESDPNYVAEVYILCTFVLLDHLLLKEDPNVVFVAPAPARITLPEFKRRSRDIILEYFESGDAADVTSNLKELGAPLFHYEFVKRLITISMDFKNRERELASRLFPSLCENGLSRESICKGFERVLEVLDDIQVLHCLECLYYLFGVCYYRLTLLRLRRW